MFIIVKFQFVAQSGFGIVLFFLGSAMSNTSSPEMIPEYQNSLAYFLGDLRSCTYSSQSKTARKLGLSHTTISRYENGHLKPPLGYLAHLASRLIEKIDPADKVIQEKKDKILEEVNLAIKWCFPDKVPFQNWKELQAVANHYLKSHQYPKENLKENEIHYNWRATPEVENFSGRVEELNQLENLVDSTETRILLLLGMAGIGKTSLIAKVVERLETKFENVIWITLYNSPSITNLTKCISSLLPQTLLTDSIQPLEQQIAILMKFFQDHRCLLIFDNLEAVMQGGNQIGSFLPEFKGYGTFMEAFATQSNQSCLVLASREKPAILDEWTKTGRCVRIFNLKGLQTYEAKLLLEFWGFDNGSEFTDVLNTHLSGNPLALIMAAELIETFYNNDIASFLQTESLIVGDIRHFLDKSFDRCSSLSRIILYWLSILRESVSIQRIEELLNPRPPISDIVKAIHSLVRSSLVENHTGKFGLQTFIAEYINDRLVREVFNSILEGQINILKQVALITTDSSLPIQQAQRQNLIQPIINLLRRTFDLEYIVETLDSLLEDIRQTKPAPQDYAAGNLITLMLCLKQDL